MVSLFPALFVFFIDINSQFDNLKSSLAMGGSLWIISMGQIESERWVTLNWTSGSFSIGTVGQLRRIKHLRNLNIIRPNQVWGVDITYIKMGKGFMYLFIIIDWYSRYIVDYELSSTLEKGFVLSCLKRAISRHKPEIINSDQGSHFTNPDYIKLLEDNGIRISMDGKGQALDNVRTERFFRSIKYDDIYINDYNSPRELRKGINAYMNMYNTYRPHDSLDGNVPINFYLNKSIQEVA